MATTRGDDLTAAQLRAVLGAIDECGAADDVASYKSAVVEAVRELFGFRDVTLFCGPTYAELFSDPAPILTGDITRLLDEYRSRWMNQDVFTTPEARRAASRAGFVTLDQLSAVPAAQRSYIEKYLLPHRMASASALHLRFADGEALVGMFDARHDWTHADSSTAQLLARHLGNFSRKFSIAAGSARPDDPLAPLTDRRLEVARLVSEGLSNAEIAAVLSITEAAVKKHLTRIFEATGCPNRAALTAAVLRTRPTV